MARNREVLRRMSKYTKGREALADLEKRVDEAERRQLEFERQLNCILESFHYAPDNATVIELSHAVESRLKRNA